MMLIRTTIRYIETLRPHLFILRNKIVFEEEDTQRQKSTRDSQTKQRRMSFISDENSLES